MNFWGAVVDIAAMITGVFFTMFFIGGASYLIGWENWSPWWMALAVVLAGSVKIKTDTKS